MHSFPSVCIQEKILPIFGLQNLICWLLKDSSLSVQTGWRKPVLCFKKCLMCFIYIGLPLNYFQKWSSAGFSYDYIVFLSLLCIILNIRVFLYLFWQHRLEAKCLKYFYKIILCLVYQISSYSLNTDRFLCVVRSFLSVDISLCHKEIYSLSDLSS